MNWLIVHLLHLLMSIASGWTEPTVADQWYVINDTVMGGTSRSQVTAHVKGGIAFQGSLSLENNGGFASARTDKIPRDWSKVSALRLTIVGDGRTYIATMRPQTNYRRLYYRQSFETKNGVEQVITLPLSKFGAFIFGRRVSEAPALTTLAHEISSVGVMLADKKAGVFSLRVLSLSGVPYEGAKPPER